MPFFANFTVTPEQVVLQSSSSTVGAAFTTRGAGEAGALALLAALVGGGFFVYTREPEQRKAISKGLVAVVIIALIVVGSVAIYTTTMKQGSSGSSTSTGSSGPQVVYAPVATVERPAIAVHVSNATSGPRISVSPDIAGVGQNITVTGQGFAPSSHLPITWSTRKGSNVVGYKLLDKPLMNVTAGADGSFSFTMKVPYDLGGIHYIAAGNLTENSNGTLFIQRTAAMSATSGPVGTKIVITIVGVGWDFNTNIATLDYDNVYVGLRLRVQQQWERDLHHYRHRCPRDSRHRHLPVGVVGPTATSPTSLADRVQVSPADAAGPPRADALVPLYIPGNLRLGLVNSAQTRFTRKPSRKPTKTPR